MQNILFLIKKYIKDFLLYTLIIVSLVFSVYNVYKTEKSEEIDINEIAITEINNEDEIEEISYINVDIKGAVKNPGVYKVKNETIINDIITLAGGFTKNAYKDGINLSKKASDEMVIYIYTTSEIKEKEEKITTESIIPSSDTCTTPNYSICECIEEKESIIKTDPEIIYEPNGETKEENTLININTALETELTTLSGIGESKAKAIINYRLEHGNFTNITDIMNVSGIGEALFAKIKNFITI